MLYYLSVYFNGVDLAWGVGMDLDRREVLTHHFKKKKIHLQLLSKNSLSAFGYAISSAPFGGRVKNRQAYDVVL